MSSFPLALLGGTPGTMAVSLVPIFAIGMVYYRYLMADPESKIHDVQNVLPEYDFIVVGGGSAGAVVANRLSENPNWSVLLLEAGGDETELSDVPSLAGYMQLSDLDWKYKTAPPPDKAYCQSMNGDRCNWPRGKVLGGSSVLNAMIYVRGNRLDYDYWAAQGNDGWSYDEVLPYFLKSEDNRNPYLAKTPYHREGGYLTVQEAPWRSPLSVAFIKAGKELGYDNRDINGANQTGFMMAQGTVRRGSRCSTAKAFLRPIKDRKNLHIALHAHVTKVLLAELDDVVTAHGVEFMRHNRRHLVNARKEVILSAGAINSPQILMLSGIGPRKHLESLGIPVFRDLKVGYNLQDHVGLGGLTFLVNAPVTFKKDRFQTPAVALEYILREKGPMTTLGVECLAFVNTKYAPPDGSVVLGENPKTPPDTKYPIHTTDCVEQPANYVIKRFADLWYGHLKGSWPDIQFHFAPSSVNSDNGDQIRKVLGLRDRVYNTVYKPLVNSETWTILPLLLRPKSSGRVKLKSTNPFDHPIIEPNYFRYKEDIAVLTEGIKIAMAISNTTAFQKYGSRPHIIPLPGCGKYTLFSDEYWECSIRHFTFTIYHPTGTCKMGPRSDPAAVVDDRLRVHGVKNLRVVDASMMPTIISGNPNAPVIMIGEKASDFIKNEYFYLDQT